MKKRQLRQGGVYREGVGPALEVPQQRPGAVDRPPPRGADVIGDVLREVAVGVENALASGFRIGTVRAPWFREYSQSFASGLTGASEASAARALTQARTHAPRDFNAPRAGRATRRTPRREDTHKKVLERERRHLLAPLARLVLGCRRERGQGVQRLGRGPHRFQLPARDLRQPLIIILLLFILFAIKRVQ